MIRHSGYTVVERGTTTDGHEAVMAIRLSLVWTNAFPPPSNTKVV